MEDSLQQVYQGILDDICVMSNNLYMDGFCTKPFVFEDYVYATNGHIMVRFLKMKISNIGDLLVSNIPERYISIFNNRTIDKTYSTDIKDYIDLTAFDWIQEGITCPECKGDCSVEYQYVDRNNHTHTKTIFCPECDSLGEIFPVGSRRYKIYHNPPICIISEVGFSAVYIGIIAQIAESLGNKTFHLIHKTERNKPCVFLAGDVEILVMPKLLDLLEDDNDLLFTLD